MKKMAMMVGYSYLRTAPAVCEDGSQDYSYTDTPIVFDGFNEDGTMTFHHPKGGLDSYFLGVGTWVLPSFFADTNWILTRNVENGYKTLLNKWGGKMIQRIRPVSIYDQSYCDEPVKLITATRYHVVVINKYGQKVILNCLFANPKDWRLVRKHTKQKHT